MTDGLPQGMCDATAEAERMAEERGWADVPLPAGPDDYGVSDVPAEQGDSGRQQDEGQQGKQQPLTASPVGDLDFASIPPRRWLLGRRFLGSMVTATIAPGGVGKSIVSMQEAVAMVTGRDITGLPVYEAGPAWIFNAEDPMEELQRRLAAICLGFEVDVSEIRDRLFVNSGQDRRLIVAEEHDGSVIHTPDVDALTQEVKKHGIKLLIVDPFVRTHKVQESDNDAMDFVVQQFQQVAWNTGCAVHLVHHTRKPPGGSSEGQTGNMDAGRGASAVAYAARVAHTLFNMSEKDAERLGVDKEERVHFFRMDDAKANLSLMSAKASWFRREGIDLPNGDQVGIGRPVDMEQAERLAKETEHANKDQLLTELVEMTGGNGGHSVNHVVQQLVDAGKYGMSPRTLRRQVDKAVPTFPGKASVVVNGVTFRLWTQRDSGGQTKPLRLRIEPAE